MRNCPLDTSKPISPNSFISLIVRIIIMKERGLLQVVIIYYEDLLINPNFYEETYKFLLGYLSSYFRHWCMVCRVGEQSSNFRLICSLSSWLRVTQQGRLTARKLGCGYPKKRVDFDLTRIH